MGAPGFVFTFYDFIHYWCPACQGGQHHRLHKMPEPAAVSFLSTPSLQSFRWESQMIHWAALYETQFMTGTIDMKVISRKINSSCEWRDRMRPLMTHGAGDVVVSATLWWRIWSPKETQLCQCGRALGSAKLFSKGKCLFSQRLYKNLFLYKNVTQTH